MLRYFLTWSLVLCGFLSATADVVVLDGSGLGDHTTFADAVTGSVAADTIYVVGYGGGYGNVSLSSPRTVIGNGYFGQSLGYHNPATFGTITLNSGATGSVFIGLTIGSVSFNEGNIDFISCHLTGSTTIGSALANIAFNKCYFTSVLNIQNSTTTVGNSIFNYGSAGNALTVNAAATPTLSYVTFYDGNLSLGLATANNCLVNSTRVTGAGSVVVDGVSGNKVDTEANLVFQGTSGGDDQFQLDVGSSALTSSQDGTESGAFGFPIGLPENAYVLSGLPDIPKIRSLEHQSESNASSPLLIRIQADAN